MDDLYADLENYNEVSCVEELRNENKELKLKLEEYATAMGKLQKDYDKLAMEFHNLQKNYSSLLKTARAEVERKSQMITQLNLEKDLMVLKALQNGSNRLLSNRNKVLKSLQNPKKALTTDMSKTDTNKKVVNEAMQKSADAKGDRWETSSASTNVSMPSSENTKLLNIVDKVVEKVETCISKGDFKENISQCKPEHKVAPKTHASSIRNRRKSMPAVSCPKFSSDEEIEPEKPTKQMTRTEIQRNEMPETRNINMILTRISNERLSNKTSETSSVDGKSSINQEPVREDLRSRINRHDNDKLKLGDRFRESDRYRGSDRFRDSVRHKENDKYRDNDRYRDTDRFRESDRLREIDKHRENDRNRESDKYKAGDKYREGEKHRDLERNKDTERYRGRDKHDSSYRQKRNYSPGRPFKRSYRDSQDDYHRSEHGRYRVIESPPPDGHYYNRGQEHWSRYERNNQDTDKYKVRCEERFVGKYPTSNDHDEPSSKRQKVETETFASDVNRRVHVDTVSKLSQAEIHEHEILRTSCQSPDAVFSPDAYAETTPVHTIKEIKNVAVTPLEDPRVTSKKYVLQSDDGKPTLSTIVSKGINIKPIDKSLWKIESVAVPDALLHKPQQQFNDDHIKEIYMDIDDNQEVNTSVEPGEIVSDSETVPDNFEKIKETKILQSNDLNKPSTEILTKQKQSPGSAPKTSYRIPKINKKNPNTPSEISNVTNNLHKIMSDTADNKHVKVAEVTKVSSQSKLKSQSLPHIDKRDNFKQANKLNKPIYEGKKYEEARISLSDTMSDAAGDKNRTVAEVTKVSSQSTLKSQSLPHIDKHDNFKQTNKVHKPIYEGKKNEETRIALSDNATDGKNVKVAEIRKVSSQSIKSQSLPHIDKHDNLKQTNKVNKINCDSKKDEETRITLSGNMSDAAEDSNVNISEVTKVSSQSTLKTQSLPHIDKHDNFKQTNKVNKPIYDNKKHEEPRISLSDIAMVHDDLELSDETSDNADFHNHILVTKEKDTLKSKLVEKVDGSENKTMSSFNIISKENNTNNVDLVADKPTSCDEKQKKQKSKRRKTKSREIELAENSEAVQETEKKSKSKKEKEKPKQIKNKFTDLFGESSSLITPEDLGIPATCVPLCEDAQDAVDINISEMAKPSPSNVNTSERNKKNDETREETSYNTNPNTEDKEIAKRIEEGIASPAIDTNIVYQNLNSEAEVNKPDVVQTIIISSGVQPQFVLDNTKEKTEQRIAGVEVNIQNIAENSQLPAVMGLRKQNYMQALATSTPHKDFSIPKPLEVESKVDCGVSNNDSKSDSIDTAGHSMDQSDANTQDSHDAPDVRIFVRRRRKGVKRT